MQEEKHLSGVSTIVALLVRQQIRTELDDDSRKDKHPACRVFGTECQHLGRLHISSNLSEENQMTYQPEAKYISRIVFLFELNVFMKKNDPLGISPFFGIAKSNLPFKASASGRQIRVSVSDYQVS